MKLDLDAISARLMVMTDHYHMDVNSSIAIRSDIAALIGRVRELSDELDKVHDVIEANGLDYDLLVEYAGDINNEEE